MKFRSSHSLYTLLISFLSHKTHSSLSQNKLHAYKTLKQLGSLVSLSHLFFESKEVQGGTNLSLFGGPWPWVVVVRRGFCLVCIRIGFGSWFLVLSSIRFIKRYHVSTLFFPSCFAFFSFKRLHVLIILLIGFKGYKVIRIILHIKS